MTGLQMGQFEQPFSMPIKIRRVVGERRFVPVTGRYSGLPAVRSLTPARWAETKRPFTLTLTHGHGVTTGTDAEESTPTLRCQSLYL